jgi:hypothetical protein
MSQDELQLCPKCNKVRMRPTGKVVSTKKMSRSSRKEARQEAIVVIMMIVDITSLSPRLLKMYIWEKV